MREALVEQKLANSPAARHDFDGGGKIQTYVVCARTVPALVLEEPLVYLRSRTRFVSSCCASVASKMSCLFRLTKCQQNAPERNYSARGDKKGGFTLTI